LNQTQDVKVPSEPYTYNFSFNTNSANTPLYRPINDSLGEFMRYISGDSLDYFGKEDPRTTKMTHTKFNGVIYKTAGE
jgi:hypothetical protein